MSNMQKQKNLQGRRFSVAAVALVASMAVFGCSTNQYPGSGEPVRTAPAGGSVTPSASSTPGSSGGATIPPTMVSGSVSPSVDAVAVIKANEGFEGTVLGPASPAPAASPAGTSTQQVTGQFIPPSLSANPQRTINSSISSNPYPAIARVPGDTTGVALTTSPAVGAALTSAPALPSTLGVNTLSTTTATSPVAATAALSTTSATPPLSTTGVGFSNVAPGTVITNANGAVTVSNATAAATPATASAGVRIQAARGVTVTTGARPAALRATGSTATANTTTTTTTNKP